MIDDHQLVIDGVKVLLDDLIDDCQFSVLGSIAAVRAFDTDAAIDVILLDVKLPDGTGLSLIPELRERFPKAPIAMLSGEYDNATVQQSIDLGAAGFIPKNNGAEVLENALQAIVAGGTYIPPTVVATALNLDAASPDHERSDEITSRISKRQRDVLLLAVQGLSNKEIARSLNITESTVKAHLSAAFKLLGVSNRTQAVYAVSRFQLA